MNINLKNGSVTINGRNYSGRNIVINQSHRGSGDNVGNKVIIDGVVQDQILSQNISVQVNGDVDFLETTSGDINVSGKAGNIKSTSGDINCIDILGNAETVSGDIKCRNIAGNARTVSGDISKRLL